MFDMLRDGSDPKEIWEAVCLALELAKWFTPDKSEEDILNFLKTKTSSQKVLTKAVVIWASAILGATKDHEIIKHGDQRS